MRDILHNTYITRPLLIQRMFDCETAVYDDREAEVVRFNVSAAVVWKHITAHATGVDICAAVARHFGVKEADVRNDVRRCITQCINLGLVEKYSPASAARGIQQVYEQIPAGACQRCARCCSSTVIYSSEFEAIAAYMRNNFSDERIAACMARARLNVATQAQQRRMMQDKGIEQMRPLEVCAFLDAEKKECLIYPVRPFACRVFGFENTNECRARHVNSGGCLERTAIAAMRAYCHAVSPFYELFPGGPRCNTAEISQWFYFQQQGKLWQQHNPGNTAANQ